MPKPPPTRFTTATATIVIAVFLGAAMTNRAFSESWVVSAVREEFGMFDALRLSSNGSVELCSFGLGEISRRQSLEAEDSDPAGKSLKDIFGELQRLEKAGWKDDGDTGQEWTPSRSPTDGPTWVIHAFKFQNNSGTVTFLDGASRFAASMNILLQEVEKNGSRHPLETGVIVWLPRNSIQGGARVARVSNPSTLGVLRIAGGYRPEPYPPNLKEILLQPEPVSGLELDGLDFAIWKTQPKTP
jgi:hypothetical protein